MPISRWIIAATLGLILLPEYGLAQAAPENQPRQEDGTSNAEGGSERQNRDPIDLSPALKDIESAIRDLIAEEDKVETKRQKDNESRDLDAQESMAFWAFWMTLATIGGVAATFLGLALIGRTLYHTKRAADATDCMLSQAKETTKAAIAAQRVSEMQASAHLSCSGLELELGDRKDSPYRLIIRLSLQNVGNSIATEVGGRFHVTILVAGSVVIDEALESSLEGGVISIEVGHSGILYRTPDHFTLAEYVQQMEKGQVSIAIRAMGRFKNIFGNVELFEYCCESTKLLAKRIKPHDSQVYFLIKMAAKQTD